MVTSPLSLEPCSAVPWRGSRGVNVDGEGIGEDTGHIGVCCVSHRTEPARHDKAGEIVVSTTRSGRDPNGVPMRGIGG